MASATHVLEIQRQSKVIQLQADMITHLEAIDAEWRQEALRQKAENADLRQHNAALKRQNTELKRELALFDTGNEGVETDDHDEKPRQRRQNAENDEKEKTMLPKPLKTTRFILPILPILT